MKKILTVILTLMLAISSLKVVKAGEKVQQFNWNGFVYCFLDKNSENNADKIKILDYVGTEKNIDIPIRINGNDVVALTEQFTCTSDIVSITIHDRIKNVDGLQYCDTLEEIKLKGESKRFTVKDGVLYNKYMTYLLCYPMAKKNTSYTVPQNVLDGPSDVGLGRVKSLKNIIFTDNVLLCYGSNIEKVVISNDIGFVPAESFGKCKKLKSVYLGKNVKIIDSGAFEECVSLNNIVLPNKLQEIKSGAFRKTALKKVKIPSNVYLLGGYAFEGCASLKKVVFSNKIKRIKYHTFENTALDEVSLPNNLNYIGKYAFYNTSIKKVYIPKNVGYIGENAFPKNTRLIMASYYKKKIHKKTGGVSYRAVVKMQTAKKEKEYKVTDVTRLTVPKKIKISKGTSKRINVGAYVCKKKRKGYVQTDILKFKSSNRNIVKVLKNGKINAVKKGTAKITVFLRTTQKQYTIKIKVS